MKIHLHDFSGHPFQVQLSRALALRGHDVLHTYCSDYVTGRGRLDLSPEDPSNLRIEGVTTKAEIVKYSPVGRLRWEFSYAKALREVIDRERSDVFIACNAPLVSLARLRRHLARIGQRWMLWHQDMYSHAIGDEAQRRLPAPLAAAVRRAMTTMERGVVGSAESVVAIGDSFTRQYRAWGLSTDHVRVIPNWAPLDEILPLPRESDWSALLPEAEFRLVYAGTIGRKHNPMLLVSLVDRLREYGVDARLLVVSEGVGADLVADACAERSYIDVLPFQPAADLPSVLASGDVLLGLLELEASQFSVPSKVASYLAAGRPVLLLAPASNPAAAQVTDAGGLRVDPDEQGAAHAALWLAELAADREAPAAPGVRSRNLAENRFDIDKITTDFEMTLQSLRAGPVVLSA